MTSVLRYPLEPISDNELKACIWDLEDELELEPSFRTRLILRALVELVRMRPLSKAFIGYLFADNEELKQYSLGVINTLIEEFDKQEVYDGESGVIKGEL